jgi:hypothetical protein
MAGFGLTARPGVPDPLEQGGAEMRKRRRRRGDAESKGFAAPFLPLRVGVGPGGTFATSPS